MPILRFVASNSDVDRSPWHFHSINWRNSSKNVKLCGQIIFQSVHGGDFVTWARNRKTMDDATQASPMKGYLGDVLDLLEEESGDLDVKVAPPPKKTKRNNGGAEAEHVFDSNCGKEVDDFMAAQVLDDANSVGSILQKWQRQLTIWPVGKLLGNY